MTLCTCQVRDGKRKCRLRSWEFSAKHPHSFDPAVVAKTIRQLKRICRERNSDRETASHE